MPNPSDRLGKLQAVDSAPTDTPGELVEAVFKVRQPNYVPAGVQFRARIDATMFTGTIQSSDVKRVQSDPNVESIEVSSRLRIIE